MDQQSFAALKIAHQMHMSALPWKIVESMCFEKGSDVSGR